MSSFAGESDLSQYAPTLGSCPPSGLLEDATELTCIRSRLARFFCLCFFGWRALHPCGGRNKVSQQQGDKTWKTSSQETQNERTWQVRKHLEQVVNTFLDCVDSIFNNRRQVFILGRFLDWCLRCLTVVALASSNFCARHWSCSSALMGREKEPSESHITFVYPGARGPCLWRSNTFTSLKAQFH